VQTYQPDHYAVVHAANQDYEGFYSEEIIYREMMGYPPVANMLAVQIFARDQERGEALAKRLSEQIYGEEYQVIGPAPAAIGKVNDVFRFVFYVKCAKYDKLITIKDTLEEKLQEWQIVTEQVQFDFNPMNPM